MTWFSIGVFTTSLLTYFVDSGQVCLSCKDVQSVSDCHNYHTCRDHEVCFHSKVSIENGESQLNFGCGLPHTCSDSDLLSHGAEVLDDDGLHQTCSICCNSTRLCNKEINCDDSKAGNDSYNLPRECQEIDNVTSGEYLIYPNGNLPSVPVYCLVKDGFIWTVFQRRTTGCLNFYRDWQSYKLGFGDVSGEYWLGNEHIHEITSHGRHALYVQVGDFDDNRGHAEYSAFYLGDERSGYQLVVTSYTGTIGDSLTQHNGWPFSTYDHQSKQSNTNQAVLMGGAWWYNSGSQSNLNGKYLRGVYKTSVHGHKGMNWNTWKGDKYSLKSSLMMLRNY